jgi:hypothetical protein
MVSGRNEKSCHESRVAHLHRIHLDFCADAVASREIVRRKEQIALLLPPARYAHLENRRLVQLA